MCTVVAAQVTDISTPFTNARPSARAVAVRLGQSGDFVVVGQREQLHAVPGRTLDKFSRRQQAVRDDRMRMQVSVECRCRMDWSRSIA